MGGTPRLADRCTMGVRFRDPAIPQANTKWPARLGARCTNRCRAEPYVVASPGMLLSLRRTAVRGNARRVWRRTHIRNRRGHSAHAGQAGPETDHLRRARAGRRRRHDPGAPESEAGRTGGGSGVRLDRFGAEGPIGDRSSWAGHPGSGAHPLHLGGDRGPGRASTRGAGAGGEGRDRAPRAQQSRRSARGVGVRAAAHCGPGRPGEPEGHSRDSAPQSGRCRRHRQGRLSRGQAQRGGLRRSGGEGAHLFQRGEPGQGAGGGAGNPTRRGRAAAGRHDRSLRLTARAAERAGRPAA